MHYIPEVKGVEEAPPDEGQQEGIKVSEGPARSWGPGNPRLGLREVPRASRGAVQCQLARLSTPRARCSRCKAHSLTRSLAVDPRCRLLTSWSRTCPPEAGQPQGRPALAVGSFDLLWLRCSPSPLFQLLVIASAYGVGWGGVRWGGVGFMAL